MNQETIEPINLHIYTMTNNESDQSDFIVDISNQTQETIIPQIEQIIEVKKRATVEYNGMEVVLPLIILYSSITNYDELIQKLQDVITNPSNYTSILLFNDPNPILGENNDFKNYYEDICKKKTIVNTFITGFRNLSLEEIPQVDKIKCIYIAGKKNKHARIIELNKECDKKAAKADIYIEYNDETPIIGISVKQSKDATKSNYSIHKMLGKELDKELTNEKKKYLSENGFSQFDKAQRPAVNKLFYPQNKENRYWLRIRDEIIKNNELLLTQLLNSLFCSNVNYDIYEFDGACFTKLNKVVDITTAKFEEHLPYYYDKSGKERETAKLFYRLTVCGKIYRVEIRWKGSVFPSPQFQIHNDECEDVSDNE